MIMPSTKMTRKNFFPTIQGENVPLQRICKLLFRSTEVLVKPFGRFLLSNVSYRRRSRNRNSVLCFIFPRFSIYTTGGGGGHLPYNPIDAEHLLSPFYPGTVNRQKRTKNDSKTHYPGERGLTGVWSAIRGRRFRKSFLCVFLLPSSYKGSESEQARKVIHGMQESIRDRTHRIQLHTFWGIFARLVVVFFIYYYPYAFRCTALRCFGMWGRQTFRSTEQPGSFPSIQID